MRMLIFIKEVVALLLVLCCVTMAVSAYDVIGLSNFDKGKNYTTDLFIDVSADNWFCDNVSAAYEYELMNGKGDARFDPYAEITLAEAVTTAVRIYYIYFYGLPIYFDDFEGGNWYEPYVAYALENGIIEDDYPDYNTPATRAQFSQILVNTIDVIDLEEVNIVEDGSIPDVPMTADYAEAVYLLYRAGVLSGSDGNGTFHPDDTITRAEAATIITRMIDLNLRQVVELAGTY